MGTPTKKQQRRYNPVAKQLSKKQYQQQIKPSDDKSISEGEAIRDGLDEYYELKEGLLKNE
jgi:hypothetical protein